MTTPGPTGLEPTLRRAVLRQAAGVAVATGAYGVSFGAVSVAAGLDVLQTCALSLLMFTGASQFALVGVLAAGGTPLLGASAAVLLGTRNLFYGVRMGSALGWRGLRRAGAAHVLIDESTAVALAHPEPRAATRLAFTATGVGVLVLWNAATLLGALAGDALGDPRRLGLDAAVGAAFLALVWPQVRGRRGLAVAAGSAAVALALVPSTPAGVPVLAAVGVAVLVGLLRPGAGRVAAP